MTSRFYQLEERIIDTLGNGACLTVREIADRLERPMGSVRKALKRLEGREIVVGWKASQKDQEYLWATDNPKYPTIPFEVIK
ncbi:MAG: hypothetical protein AAGC77_09500 [Pseudomonadota bacterium]